MIGHAMATAKIDAVLQGAVADGVAAGFVGIVANRDGERHRIAVGTRTPGLSEPMAVDTIFWIASMTKLITTVAVMQLVEAGRLTLDAPVAALLPELAQPDVLHGFDPGGSPVFRPAQRAMTLRQLLTHTSGSGYEMMNPDLMRARGADGPPAATALASLTGPLAHEPGAGWTYGYGIDWAGLAVERVTGRTLDHYFADNIFTPLGMRDTGFGLWHGMPERAAATCYRRPDGALVAIEAPASDPDAWEFRSGGAGLSATAGDYIRLLRMLLGGGILDGARVLAQATVDAMWDNQIGDLTAGALQTAVPEFCCPYDPFPGQNAQWSLLGLMNPQRLEGRRHAASAAWCGLGGTMFWIDRDADVCGVLMAQLLPFADPALLAVQRAFEAAIYR